MNRLSFMSGGKNAPFSIRNLIACLFLSLAAIWRGVPDSSKGTKWALGCKKWMLLRKHLLSKYNQEMCRLDILDKRHDWSTWSTSSLEINCSWDSRKKEPVAVIWHGKPCLELKKNRLINSICFSCTIRKKFSRHKQI